MWNRLEKSQTRGKVFGGLIIVTAGVLFLLREMDFDLPYWLFSWEVILIVAGIYVGVKHAFRNIAWFIMILVGVAFLLKDYYHEYNFSHYLWPIAIIIGGLYMIFRPKRNWENHRWKRQFGRHQRGFEAREISVTDREDFLEVNAVFGNVNKNIISKPFLGGEINCVFGGAEINFIQADINGTVKLEVNCVFGGARLIVPANWEIKSELAAVMGNVEDKRPIQNNSTSDGSKVLILHGNAVFGGIEIKSY